MDQNRKLAELYLEAIYAEGTAIAASIETYRFDLDCYLRFLNGDPLPDVTLATVRKYLASLEGALAPNTIAHRRAVIGELHRFLAAEGIADSNPVDLIDPMKRQRSLPLVISMADVDTLLSSAHERARNATAGLYRQAGYARRAAMLETLYASGLRISEALAMQFATLRDVGILVQGKGGRERLAFLHDTAIAAIERWRALAMSYHGQTMKWVFCSLKNPSQPLTRQAFDLEIKEAAREAGLRKAEAYSAHKLRHAFASHLLANGVDLRSLQEMLGHADIGTTEIYTHVLDHRRINMVRDLHPLNDQI